MFIEYKGSQIYYVSEGNGKPMLFLHNGGASHTIWRHLMKYYSDTREVIALDLPGYGMSSGSGYSCLEEYVECVKHVVEQLVSQSSELIIVGNCLGSAIALMYAEKYPSYVKSVIVFNPLSNRSFREGFLGFLEILTYRYLFYFSYLFAVFLSIIPFPDFLLSLIIRFQLGTSCTLSSLVYDDGLLECYRRRFGILALFKLLSFIGNIPNERDLSVPVCIIWGLENRVLSPGQIFSSRKYIKGSGHLPMLENPSRCIEIINDTVENRPFPQ
jgi:pimeloyl-ACP methyl ester carboxylesterase